MHHFQCGRVAAISLKNPLNVLGDIYLDILTLTGKLFVVFAFKRARVAKIYSIVSQWFKSLCHVTYLGPNPNCNMDYPEAL